MKITEENFLLVAMHSYDNVQCTDIEEFNQDLMRFMYLNRLFNRYRETGELKERLILNHILVISNLFGNISLDLLLFKTLPENYSYLMTFLVFLNKAPENDYSDIKLDTNIIEKLRAL